MCFTGNFALTMMLEPAMLAPVLSQPSLPLDDPAGLEIAPDELAAVRERLEREDLTVLAYRFEGDRFCRAQRFAAYAEALGDRFVARVLPDSAANPDAAPFFEHVVASPHSVVTAHLIDEAGQPTIAARDEILAFFAAAARLLIAGSSPVGRQTLDSLRRGDNVVQAPGGLAGVGAQRSTASDGMPASGSAGLKNGSRGRWSAASRPIASSGVRRPSGALRRAAARAMAGPRSSSRHQRSVAAFGTTRWRNGRRSRTARCRACARRPARGAGNRGARPTPR